MGIDTLAWAAALLLVVASAGCGSQTTLVQPGTAVKLAEPVSAYIFVSDAPGHFVKSNNRVSIPAGWDCIPPATQPSK